MLQAMLLSCCNVNLGHGLFESLRRCDMPLWVEAADLQVHYI